MVDELADWRSVGVDAVLSLLTPAEERDLDIENESREVEARGMQFLSFPIADRQAPEAQTEVAVLLERLDADLFAGKNVVVHCRQGVGRTGLIAACLLISKGWKPETTLSHLAAARGIPVPKTLKQRCWIELFSTVLTNAG